MEILFSPSILSLLFISLIQLYAFLKRNKKTVPLPPGPSTWPILGCIPQMWRNRPAYRWIHRVMDELRTDIACFRLGTSQHVVAVGSPEMAREFLRKHDAVFSSRPVTMATRILSHGFITTGVVPWGKQWKKMRRILVSNVFNNATVRWLLPKRNLEADNLIRFLYRQCSASASTSTSRGKVVNVRSATQHYSASIMRRMMFNIRHFGEGREDGGPCFQDEEHVSALFTMLLHVYAFSISDYIPCLRWLDLDGHRKTVRNAMQVINKYHNPIVNDRIRRWRQLGTAKPEPEPEPEPQDLLDVFISLKDSNGHPLLSDEEIRAQVTELFLAVIDTPYSIAEWALSEMLNQPEMLEKAVEELDRVVGKDRLVQESDIPRLPYVVACAREALRLHPVAPFNLPHVSTEDCIVNGYFIPKGSSVLLSRLGLGRNPCVWEDPLRFEPNRHLKDHHADLAEAELRFISFTTGRRGCIGVELGSNITVMLLGRLLQGFTWKIPDGVDKIDLTEAVSLFKATPLFAHAKPRLNESIYLSLVV